MKVTIDRDACMSDGIWWDTCPAFFEQNAGDSLSLGIEKFRSGNNPSEGSAPKDKEVCVTGAAGTCPARIVE